jgi:membrane protein implicated in regulation of membrane protease activity
MKGFRVMLMGLGLMIAAISLTSIGNVTLAWTISAAGIVIFLVSGYLFLKERGRRK